MNWKSIISDALIAEVIPEEYARYRTPLRESLVFFLSGLSEVRQSEIFTGQLSCTPDATAPERIAVLARGCPSLHKMGQTLARDDRLSPELRRHLRMLESLSSTFPSDHVHDILENEINLRDGAGIQVLPALAEASVAVVVPFERKSDGRAGVFKILKPGIKERLEEELAMLERTGALLDQRIEEFGIPPISYQETFEQVRRKLLSEVRLDVEQRNLVRARNFYADEPGVLIPALFPEYCTPQVTAMERVYGKKITDSGFSGKWENKHLAELVISQLIARPILSRNGRDVFHGDPHPGNLFITDDGRLAILDWSLMGTISEREHSALSAIIIGAVTARPERIETALLELADTCDFDPGAVKQVVAAAISEVTKGRSPGLLWMTSMLDSAVTSAAVRFRADLLLFRRVMHILNGVVADLAGDVKLIDEVVIQKFIGSFLLEWPFRWIAPPYSREFPTRLSNADIIDLIISLPWNPARFWMGMKT